MFRIYAYASPQNRLAWEGSVTDDTCPIAFRETLERFGKVADTGDTIALGDWHYAVKL